MPRDERMFGDVVDPSVKMGNRQGGSVLLTILLETSWSVRSSSFR